MTNNGIIEYECPCCGGKIEFDTSIQKPKCPYCDTEFELETLKSYDEALHKTYPEDGEELKTPESEWSEEEKDDLRSYICKSCGGEIMTDATTAATHCPFCDNPIVLADKLAGGLKPELVIPFKLDKKAAKEALSRHLNGKRLLPKVFRDQNHIDEIKGVYVPFWLFDADADADVRMRGTRVRTWSDANYRYTDTRYYAINRGGRIAFANVPVDGSTKMDDTLMESIEPFDLSQGVDFQTAYLSGFFADRYDVPEFDSKSRADQRMKNAAEQAFRNTVSGYSSVTVETSNVRLHGPKARYALYPVWLLNTTWHDQKYTFAMNGQTGKFVGDLPMDSGLFWKWFFGIMASVTAVVFAIVMLIGG